MISAKPWPVGMAPECKSMITRWYRVESKPEWPKADYFKVRGSDECEYLLKHDFEADEWFLGQQL